MPYHRYGSRASQKTNRLDWKPSSLLFQGEGNCAALYLIGRCRARYVSPDLRNSAGWRVTRRFEDLPVQIPIHLWAGLPGVLLIDQMALPMIVLRRSVILAIDPGTSKLGWAVVSDDGRPFAQGIWAAGNWEAGLARLDGLEQIRTVVLGDGTNRMNIEQGLKRLLPVAQVAVVDEKESTVDAWKLKRIEEAGSHPLKTVRFMFMQLFQPVPVDDYAARVLALRYLAGLVAKGNGRSSAG